MSIAKCEGCGHPQGSKRNYVQAVRPIGYPDSAALCNSSGCFKPAMIWLDEAEEREYSAGERIFMPITGAIKIRVL